MRNTWMVFWCLALTPVVLVAQVVRGVVEEERTGAPVLGAMVIVAEAGGDPVLSVLTDAAGHFIVQVHHPGRYEIRVDRIGYASLTTDPFDVPVEGTFRTVVVPIAPVALAGLDVESARRCEVRPEDGRVTAQVWEEARKALAAAAWTQASGKYRYTLLHYVRDLDRGGRRIEKEERTFVRGTAHAPFVSLPARELIAGGFVQPDSTGAVMFNAPDAEAFLSDPFLDTHCMGVTRGDDGELGLTFEPIQGRRVSDIEGVLWLDETTAVLRRLEFSYRNVRGSAGLGNTGGEVDFTALPDGTWIVREFRIRMPVVSMRRRVPRLQGYRDEGGIAWRVTDPEGSIVLEAGTASISGVVTDSTGAPPTPPAEVRVQDVEEQTTTGDDGSFLVTGLPEGLSMLEVRHPSLDTLGLLAPPVGVEAALGAVASATLAVARPRDVLDFLCGGGDPPPNTTILFGRVLDAAGAHAGDAGVRLYLPAGALVLARRAAPKGPDGEADIAWHEGTSQGGMTLETRTDARGIFMLCDVPAPSTVRIEVWRGDGAISFKRFAVPGGSAVAPVTMTLQEGRRP